MRIVSRDGTPIDSLDAWKERAAPAGKDGWREGYSAAELARAWTQGSAEADVTALLTAHPDLAGLKLVEGTAEKQTSFDDIPSGPRNHDLLIEATVPRGRVVIGVEGKGNEPFDRTTARYRTDNEPKVAEGSRAIERLDRLEHLLFGRTDVDDDVLAPVRYQLLSATAGTLADAKEPEAVGAVLLVHELRTSASKPDVQAANANDLEDFVALLAPGDAEPARHEGPGGWVAGPIRVHADQGKLPKLPASMLLYVAKLSTDQS